MVRYIYIYIHIHIFSVTCCTNHWSGDEIFAINFPANMDPECMYIYIYTHLCMLYMYICIYCILYMYICIYCMYIYVYTICIYVYMYIYMYIYHRCHTYSSFPCLDQLTQNPPRYRHSPVLETPLWPSSKGRCRLLGVSPLPAGWKSFY